MPEVAAMPLAVSVVLFVATVVGFLVRAKHRTTIAFTGAILAVTLGTWLRFYPAENILNAVNYDAVALLLGTMLLASLAGHTGLLQAFAVRAVRAARGRLWLLFLLFCLCSLAASMVFDNVSTVLLLVPVFVSIADVLDRSPVPFLFAGVIFANLGGAGTLIGSTTNILIGTAADLSFSAVFSHLAPLVLAVAAAGAGVFLAAHPSIWRTPATATATPRTIEVRRAIENPRQARILAGVIAGTLTLLFLHHLLGLPAGPIALLGALIGVLAIKADVDATLKAVRWDVLLFLIALFIVVGCVRATGVLDVLGSELAVFAHHNAKLAVVAVFWATMLGSALLGGVPFVMIAVPVLVGWIPTAGPLSILWWALAIGAGLGANLTARSLTALAITPLARSLDISFDFRSWIRHVGPVCLTAALLTTGALLLAEQCIAP